MGVDEGEAKVKKTQNASQDTDESNQTFIGVVFLAFYCFYAAHTDEVSLSINVCAVTLSEETEATSARSLISG